MTYRVLIAAAVPLLWMIFANLGRAEPPARQVAARVRAPDVRPAPPDLTQPDREPLAIIRNPFAFVPRGVSPIPTPPPIAPPEAVPESPSSVALSLIGVATATLADGGAERTAIIAGPDGVLYMVRNGDAVTTRVRVDAVLPESVRLVDDATGASFSLCLR